MVARGCRIKKVCCASSARNRRSARASGWRLSVVSLMKTCLVVARERSSAMTSGAVAELEVGGPARGGREDQLGDELVVLERGGEAAEEERGRWDAAPSGDDLRVEHEADRAVFAGRVGVRDRAADGAPVADLGIANLRGRRRQQRHGRLDDRVLGQVTVAGQGADANLVVVTLDEAELAHVAYVDQGSRRGEIG